MIETFDKCADAFLVLQRLSLLYEIDLVLQDDDVFELHDLDGGEMFGCLRLRTRFVSGDEEQCGVHDGGAVQHRGHENVVARAVDEGYVSDELHAVSASGSFAGRIGFLVGAIRAIAARSRASFVFAFVYLAEKEKSSTTQNGKKKKEKEKPKRTHFGICVAELDRDVSDELVLESDSHDARDRLYDRRLSVGDMADSAW